MRTGLVISALLHAGVAAVLLFGPIEIVDRPDRPVDLPLDMVFEPPEPALPDFGDDFAELDAATSEEPAPLPAPEPAGALDEPVPDAVPEEVQQEEVAEAEPVEPIETARRPIPDPPAEAPAEGPGETPNEVDAREPEVADPEPTEQAAAPPEPGPSEDDPVVPETDTAAAEPEVADEPPTAAVLPPAPVPKRKPVQALAAPKPEPVEPLQEATREVERAETESEPSNAPDPETEPEPAYRTPTVTGALTPSQLLDNLAALRDEEAQAKNDPALWAVIRAVRAQVARCWLINPAETRNANLSVDIAVAFDKSGNLLQAKVQEVGRMVTDESFKNFAMAAHSALKSCSPFELPQAQYDLWQRFTMRFVPRKPS